MLDAIDHKTTLLYIANPNNPTGTFAQQTDIRSFLDRVPENVVVVLDEAYAEYLPDSVQSCPATLVKRYSNLIVVRTFSKAYGLAALRIGYCMAQPQLTALLNRVRPSFNTNSFAQVAAAAAVSDVDFLSRSRRMNDLGRKQLRLKFDRLGLSYINSAGNFVMVNVGNGNFASRDLMTRAIVVRPMSSYGLCEWIRVSIGLPEQNELFYAKLLESCDLGNLVR